MSKTFTGTVNFTYRVVLEDTEIATLLEYTDENYPDNFIRYLHTLHTVDDVICAIISYSTRKYLKEKLIDNSVTFSPISVKVEAKKRA